MIGSLLARYATKAMLITAAKAAYLVARKATPHVIAHKLATTIAKKRKRIDKGVTGYQEPYLKKASVDTGGITLSSTDLNDIVLD